MASIYRKKGGDIWYYGITYQGKRYQGTTKTTDKKSAQFIAESMQTDLAREKHNLPVLNKNINSFGDLFQDYLKNIINSSRTIQVKQWISIHFLPVFKDKDTTSITQSDIKNYQL